MSQVSSADGSPTAAFSAKYRYYILLLLTVAYVSNYADRYVLAVTQEQLRAEFGLADWQLGFLGGSAFAIFYSVFGIPIARLAERFNRVRIISISLTIWSAMTAVCGLATSIPMLVLARMGVGIGEAGGTPPAHSLISNYFPATRRATALAIYSSAMPIGTMLVAIVGGWIAHEHGWRAVFIAFGAPGLLIAVLLTFTAREPARVPLAVGESIPTFRQTLGVLLAKGTYRHALAGSVIFSFANAGIVQFTTSFFVRTHGLSLTQANLIFGVAQGVFAFIGTLVGGLLVDRLQRRHPTVAATVGAASSAACALLFVLAFIAPVLWIGIGALMIGKFAQWLSIGPTFSMMQAVAPERGRATAQAIYLFCISLIGSGLGPLLIGAVSDLVANVRISAQGLGEACAATTSTLPACVAARADGLQWAMIIFCLGFLWSAIHYLRARKFMVTEVG